MTGWPPPTRMAAKHGGRLQVSAFDLTDCPATRSEVDRAFAAGRIDVVFSNGGYGLFGAAEEVADEQMERRLAVNLLGPMRFVRTCLPHLRVQGGGCVVQTFSVAAQRKAPRGERLAHIAGRRSPVGVQLVGPLHVRAERGARRSWPDDHGSDPNRRDPATPTEPPRRSSPPPTPGHPPRRLVLGSAAYRHVGQALDERLALLRLQEEVAFGADKADPRASA